MCDFCGYTRESGNCVFVLNFDETQHWEECETCGYKTDTVEHAVEIIPGYAATCTENGLTEGAKCSVCGLILSEQTTIYARHYFEMTYTETTHKRVCTVCGGEGDNPISGSHEFGAYQHDETYHWRPVECWCGYKSEGEKLPHDKSYINNGQNHTVVCYECEYAFNEAHTIVYNAIEGGHSLHCEYCSYSVSKNCVDEDGDSKCDLCGQDVELETTTYTEVDVVEGELAVGNVYRIYRSVASGTRLYLTGITCSVSAEENPMYGSLYFAASSEADSLEYWFGAGWLGYKLEGMKVVQTIEYIDIYIEAGTYNLSNGEATITIAEDATVSSISGGTVKRLVANEKTTYMEVDVADGEAVAGNWYRLYRPAYDSSQYNNYISFNLSNAPCTGENWTYSENLILAVNAYNAETGQYEHGQDGYVWTAGPMGSYLVGLQSVITIEYIDIYLEVGVYDIKGYDATVEITTETTISLGENSAYIKRLVANEE